MLLPCSVVVGRGWFLLELENAWIIFLLHLVDEVNAVEESWWGLHSNFVRVTTGTERVLVTELKLA